MILSRRRLPAVAIKKDAAACLLCSWREFSTSYHRQAKKPTAKITPSHPTPKEYQAPSPASPSALADAPRSYGRANEKFTPKPLDRPIGLTFPPRAGENTGKDIRSLKQRRDDFVDYDKHLARRKELTHKVASPYFREWDNMRFSKGKSFVAPPNIFKSALALYFPNLHGQTLVKGSRSADTTPILEGKISIISVFSTQWAENQTITFVGEKNNPDLHEVIKSSRGLAQMVQINLQENWMMAMLIKIFMPSLRKRLGGIERWERYFLIRRGFPQDMKEAIGILNTKVGYTYILDGNCKIRWAGSGPAESEEKYGLVRAVKRLLEEAKQPAFQVSHKPMIEALKTASGKKPVASAA